ncbi:uncharacterized protein MYCFIDRAFT_79195 [Pseudocercospora fijiensis CIRAD86]|uniref:F-box domain-containing protein n=1 Tax=Pseudocercospora fijiensis (strain CIRAD86) TaxID=383855 RepID=M3A0L4_PSEFD|nr:uncharacterized protein MYCFIDRAFT_79195 [Pseudocercospora fijiensis CIRAD86]EME77951.1 hypothetical protein MYCFIDRAFT_79195 [Pseudocercospora fijiensis CIRAD86]
MHTTPRDAAQDPCWFLDSLPAELRNEIYELVFNPNLQKSRINLFKANPPEKSLLLSCKQIYSEAKVMHRDAHRKYWKKNDFFIDSVGAAAYNVELTHIHARDVDQITKLHVIQDEAGYVGEAEVRTISYTLDGQHWNVRHHDGTGGTYKFCVSIILPAYPRGLRFDYYHDQSERVPSAPTAPLHLHLMCLFAKTKKCQYAFVEDKLPVWGRLSKEFVPPERPQMPPTPEFIRRALKIE